MRINMRRISLPQLRKKPRKYPIKRDEYGKSARRRAFDEFDEGKRPGEVSRMIEISLRTACRYFSDWKKLPQNLESNYQMMRSLRKSNGELSKETIELLGAHLGMSTDEVTERLEKPWAVKQLLMGRWPNLRQERARSKAEVRLLAAPKLINLVESSGVPPETILQQLLKMRPQREDP